MKKIGILHGKERSFPEAFVARVNSKNVPGLLAQQLLITLSGGVQMINILIIA